MSQTSHEIVLSPPSSTRFGHLGFPDQPSFPPPNEKLYGGSSPVVFGQLSPVTYLTTLFSLPSRRISLDAHWWISAFSLWVLSIQSPSTIKLSFSPVNLLPVQFVRPSWPFPRNGGWGSLALAYFPGYSSLFPRPLRGQADLSMRERHGRDTNLFFS